MHGQYLIIYRRASTSVHTTPRGTRKAIGSQAGGGATVSTRLTRRMARRAQHET